jgi:non-homologous end joining protein Ku
VTTPQELDELAAKIAADHPDVTHMEIFYQDDESTIIDMATFDGSYYIYRSTDNYNRAFQLMREAANT